MANEKNIDMNNADDDGLELERSFEQSANIDTAADSNESTLSPNKPDEYIEDLMAAEQAQAEAEVAAELEQAEKRKKDKEKALKRDKKAFQEAHEKYERDMAIANGSLLHNEQENTGPESYSNNDQPVVYSQGNYEYSSQAEYPAGDFFARETKDFKVQEPDKVISDIGSPYVDNPSASGEGSKSPDTIERTEEVASPDEGNLEYSPRENSDISDIANEHFGVQNNGVRDVDSSIEKDTAREEVFERAVNADIPESSNTYTGSGYDVPNAEYPDAFSEAEKRRKDYIAEETENRQRQQREENQALLDKLNREAADRQKSAENYTSFGHKGIDYSGNEHHGSVSTLGEDPRIESISEKEFQSLKENYENSRATFKSYGDTVPESVMNQYKADSDLYFSAQRKLDNGSLVISRISESPVPETRSPSSSHAFNSRSGDALLHGNEQRAASSYPEGVSESIHNRTGSSGSEYDSNRSSVPNAAFSDPQFSRTEFNQFEQNMARQAATVFAQTWDTDASHQFNNGSSDVAGSTPFASRSNSISQERYDSLRSKFLESEREVASYQGKDVPSAVSEKNARLNKLYSSIEEKVSNGTISVVSRDSGFGNESSERGNKYQHSNSGNRGSSRVSGTQVFSENRAENFNPGDKKTGQSGSGNRTTNAAFGTQAFSDRRADNFAPGGKRIGERHIKNVGTPFQGSPINKYDKLKIYHSHQFGAAYERATSRAVSAVSYAMIGAARSEQTGTVNTMVSTQERAREAMYAARVMKDLPRQLKAGMQSVQAAYTSTRNVGRFLQGKELLNPQVRTPVSMRQINKQLQNPFSSAQMSRLHKKFGSDVHLSMSKINNRILVQTAKNKGLKAEIKRLQTKGAPLSASEKERLKDLIAEKKIADLKLRKYHGLKKAHIEAAVGNRKVDRLSKKSIEKTLRKNSKNGLRLSKKEKLKISHMKDRADLLKRREKLFKAKGARRNLTASLGYLLGSATRGSDDSSIQSILAADRVLQNRYVRSILKASTKAVLLPAKLAKKTVVGSYKAGRFLDNKLNKGRIGAKIDSGANKVKSINRAVKKAGEKAVGSLVNSRAYKGLNGGIYKRVKKKVVSRMPDKIKTRVTKGQKLLSNIKSKRNAVLDKFKMLKKRFQNSKLGKISSAISKGAGGVFKAFGFAKKALIKVGLYCASFVIIVAMIGAAISAAGGAVSSLFMGDDSDDGRIDVTSYIKILNDKEQDFLEEIDHIASDPKDKYDVITVNYQSGTLVNNFKEILSMTAVYFDQDFSDTDAVKSYIQQLYEDSHYYLTIESEPYSCAGCETRSYKCTESYDEFATKTRIHYYDKYSDRGGCKSHKHVTTNYCGGCVTDDNGVATGACPGHKNTYYTYSCSGHSEIICRGEHVDLDINVMVLGFDEMFYADSSINTSVGNATKGEEIGTFTITYYCTERYHHICNAGPPYKTASGTDVTPGRTIAVDKSVIPLGTHVIINGHEYIAEDTGGAIKGNRIDVAVATHNEALQMGKKTYKVYYAETSGGSSGENKSDKELQEKSRSVTIPYLEYAKESATESISQQLILQAFGQAKEPEVAWQIDRVNHDTVESFDLKLREYDAKHKNEAFTNAELNTFEYVKMSKDQLAALAKERTGEDASKSSSFMIISNVLIPYDKKHPDEYIVDPDSSSATEFYFEGWNAENIQWSKDILENFTKDNYKGLDKINQFDGKNTSYEGVVFTQGETQVVYYNQYDVRWKNLPYSSSTIGVSGCGPTSMAMVVSSLTKTSIDPIKMCNWSSSNGYYIKGAGTAWAFIEAAAENWGLSCQNMGTGNAQKVVSALSQGKLVVMSTGAGSYYSGDGHFLVLRGVENGKILVADPASKEKSETSWTLEQITSGLKNWWIIGAK